MIQRIQKIMQLRNLTPSAFADRIGVPRSTISHVLSGRNNPSLELVQKILDSFSDIRTEWLVRGKGNMLAGTSTLFSQELSFDSPEPAREKEPKPEAPEQEISVSQSKEQEIHQAEAVIRKDENAESRDEKSENLSISKKDADKSLSKTTRVMVFFSDGTFREYLPAAEN